MNAFVIYGIADRIELRTIFAGIMPFSDTDIIRINLLLWFPILALVLPRALDMSMD